MFYRQKVNQEFSQQFLTLFQHWEIDVQKAEEQEEKLTVRIMLSFIINLFNQVLSRNGEPSLVGDPQNSPGSTIHCWLYVLVLLNGKPEMYR